MKLNWQVAALAIIVMKIRNGSLRLQHLEQNAHGVYLRSNTYCKSSKIPSLGHSMSLELIAHV